MLQTPRQRETLPATHSALEAPQSKNSEQIVELPISDILTNGGTHARENLNEQHIQDLEQELDQGHELDPMDVFWDGSIYWLSDGFHRIEAYIRAIRTLAKVRIQQGSQRDAILHGIKANAKHKALKWSRQDKQRAIKRLLRDPDWQQWSDNAIAQICGVDNKTVTQRRLDLGIPKSDFRRGSDGRIINTGPISESSKARKTSRLKEENYIFSGSEEELEVGYPSTIAPRQEELQEDRHLEELSHQGLPDQPFLSQATHSTAPAKLDSVQIASRPQTVITTTRPSSRKRVKENKPFVAAPKRVQTGEWLKLGKDNYLYCGDPLSEKFQRNLPESISFSLTFSPSDRWHLDYLSSKLSKSLSSMVLHTVFVKDQDLSLFRQGIERFLQIYTEGGEVVVLSFLPDPAILPLIEQLECRFICADPDPKRCDAAITVWTTIGQTAKRMN